MQYTLYPHSTPCGHRAHFRRHVSYRSHDVRNHYSSAIVLPIRLRAVLPTTTCNEKASNSALEASKSIPSCRSSLKPSLVSSFCIQNVTRLKCAELGANAICLATYGSGRLIVDVSTALPATADPPPPQAYSPTPTPTPLLRNLLLLLELLLLLSCSCSFILLLHLLFVLVLVAVAVLVIVLVVVFAVVVLVLLVVGLVLGLVLVLLLLSPTATAAPTPASAAASYILRGRSQPSSCRHARFSH